MAIEALKETLNELAIKYEFISNDDKALEKEFIENSTTVFESSKVDNTAIVRQKDRCLRKIENLEMQLDFAKRVSRQFGIEILADD